MPINQKILFRILLAALILQLSSALYYLYCINVFGYLPAPFVLDKADTFMDLYNTLWWSARDGRYTDWHSVYPPLNFIILDMVRSIFASSGIAPDPLYLRATTLGPACLVSALFVAAPAFIVTRSGWSALGTANRILIAIVALLSPILLFSIERGNLLVLPLLLLPFVFSEKDGWWKPLLLGVIVNLKPYLALLILAYVLTGDWRRFLQSLAFAGAIFLLTGLIVDSNFLLLLVNLSGFANSAVLPLDQLLALPASPSALSRSILMFLDATKDTNPHLSMLASGIEAIKSAAVMLGICALVLRRRAVRLSEALVLMLVTIITAGVWAGGYSQLFYLAIVPVLLRMSLRNLYLALLLIIFLPWDMLVLHSEPAHMMLSFIGKRAVDPHWQIGLGSLVRPLCNLALVASLALEIFRRDRPSARDAKHRGSAWNLLPIWRLVIPAGMMGLMAGAVLYWASYVPPAAATVIRIADDTQRADARTFLTEMLERRSPAQIVAEKLQTPGIAMIIAEGLSDPGLARSLAGRQYGGRGTLRTRLTSDARFLEISVASESESASLNASMTAAALAIQLADASMAPAENATTPSRRATPLDILIASAIEDRLTTTSSMLDGMLRLKRLRMPQDTAGNRSQVFVNARLVTPMIDRWQMGAAIGALAFGSIAYAAGLSRISRRT